MAEKKIYSALAEYRKRLPIEGEKGLKITGVSLSHDEKTVIFHFSNNQIETVPGELFIKSVLPGK